MDSMQISASSYASTVVNVHCQNAKNSTWALIFCMTSRLTSRRTILISVFALYTFLGAVTFQFLESANEAILLERKQSQIERKRFEMMHRIQLSWENYGSTKIRSQFYNDSLNNFRWYENEWIERKFYRKPETFWTYDNALWFVGASLSTVGFHLNVLKTKAGRALYICFSTFGICLFCICSWRIGYVMNTFLECLLRTYERYRTSRPRAKSLIIFGFTGVALLAGQHGLIYYVSECESYMDILETHFYTITTLGLTNPDICVPKKLVNRLLLLICIFTWLSTVAALVHSFQRQQYLLYKYIFDWLLLQTEENLHTPVAFYVDHDSPLFKSYLNTALQGGFFERTLLKTLSESYLRKLYKLYHKLYQRYGQHTQTAPIRLVSKGTMTRAVFLWKRL